MKQIIRQRLLGAIPLLIGITFLSFLIMHAAPGDPTAMMMDPSVTAADMAQIRQNLGMDKPILLQYFYWIKEVCKGNLGYSYTTGQPVLSSILARLPATLILSLSSLACILLITLPLGLWSGWRAGSAFDRMVTVFSFVGFAVPTFWLGLMMILGLSLKLGLFPSSGYMDPFLFNAPWWKQANSILSHLALPLLTIIIGEVAGLTRYYRGGVIAILKSDYILAARARGISDKSLLFRHAFKNAVLPVITLLGLGLPGLISGSFVIEYIFAWPGMGQMGVAAVFSRDYPILMGTLLLSSVLIVLGNLLADVSYAAIDPRTQN